MAFLAGLVFVVYLVFWLIVAAAIVAVCGDVIGLWDAVSFV